MYVTCLVLKYIKKLKNKVLKKSGFSGAVDKMPSQKDAFHAIVLQDQREHFPEIFKYFCSIGVKLKDTPQLVCQLNIFRDDHGLLRVKHKLKRWIDEPTMSPVLLSKDSILVPLILKRFHEELSHAGLYMVLSEFRKHFWVPRVFITVKKFLKGCVQCRRVNGRPIELNQSPYREFRLNPSNIPFRNIFIDHIGPITVKVQGSNTKIYLLLITCLWSRAINLLVCRDMTVRTFIRAMQIHIYSYGVPEFCLSDPGSTIVGGGRLIAKYLDDDATREYFKSCGIKGVKFEQYAAGKNELGGLVESCVKITKRLIFGSIRNLMLDFLDFELLIYKVVHLANRRPIAFKNSLRDGTDKEYTPSPITPEILLRGYELVSVNIIPGWGSYADNDPNWVPEDIDSSLNKLQQARKFLMEIYSSEFLSDLSCKATNEKTRYKRVQHAQLKIGDLVLIKEPFVKPNYFPMGRVLEIKTNDLGEVTDVVLLKGQTGEKVHRHVTSLIYYLTAETVESSNADVVSPSPQNTDAVPERPKRRTAEISRDSWREAISAGDL